MIVWNYVISIWCNGEVKIIFVWLIKIVHLLKEWCYCFFEECFSEAFWMKVLWRRIYANEFFYLEILKFDLNAYIWNLLKFFENSIWLVFLKKLDRWMPMWCNSLCYDSMFWAFYVSDCKNHENAIWFDSLIEYV